MISKYYLKLILLQICQTFNHLETRQILEVLHSQQMHSTLEVLQSQPFKLLDQIKHQVLLFKLEANKQLEDSNHFKPMQLLDQQVMLFSSHKQLLPLELSVSSLELSQHLLLIFSLKTQILPVLKMPLPLHRLSLSHRTVTNL